MAEEQDALFVSDEGEIRWMPEHAGELEVREAVLTGQPWRGDAAGPHGDPAERRWRKVDLAPPLREGIRSLLRERDEARENVGFLMDMLATTILEGQFPGRYSEGLQGMWQRWKELFRTLRDQDWFRDREA